MNVLAVHFPPQRRRLFVRHIKPSMTLSCSQCEVSWSELAGPNCFECGAIGSSKNLKALLAMHRSLQGDSQQIGEVA